MGPYASEDMIMPVMESMPTAEIAMPYVPGTPNWVASNQAATMAIQMPMIEGTMLNRP